MKFIKNFNNNAALVEDEQGTEWIVIGNGVGFGKKKGMLVDEGRIERRFVTAEKNSLDIESFKEIESQSLELTTKVIELVEPLLKIRFNDYQYFVLADHIDFSLKRAHEGIEISDGTVIWEISKLFSEEYQAAKEAINLINQQARVQLPKNEIVFMTYHFVNASMDGSRLQDTIKITKLISGIIDIIQYQFHLTLDTESFNYSRFVTHLRALMVQRVSKTSMMASELDPALLKLMQLKYPLAYETTERIGDYLQKETNWKLQPDDKVYLTLHVWRVTHRQKNNKSILVCY
ncbi:PRD domain-containing protein [Liquorilactobacillus mali]|uniref:Transcription antiterminator n=1 Tax=Liquorilactobacillus mali TaxID=1618 RepID=A0A0R2FN15_9LACO|nr:PRD domain-containing protein [Liquorilactobacillus mali]KRN29921.1 transcription antiterminator [Liquorilactobacillus mali]MDN7145937.1 PRD domain-containing protein [Liquorilactobacillus mali]